MKNLFLLLFSVFSFALFSQAPQTINYQGVVRNQAGVPITTLNTIGLKFEISDGTNVMVHQETQNNVSVNNLGLFNTRIGLATPLSNTITWQNGPYTLSVSVDVGTGLNFLGAQQMVSVPYALYAQRAGSAPSQSLSINGNSLSISGGNSVSLPGGGAVPNTTITGSGVATVTSLGTNTFDVFVPPVNISGSPNTTVTGSYPNYTITGAAGSTPTITGANGVNVASAGNAFTVAGTPVILNGSGGTSILGAFPNFTINSAAGASPTIVGINASTVTAAANSYTVNTPAVNITGAPGASVTGGFPNYTISATGIPPAITGINASTVTAAGNSFTVNTPPVTIASALGASVTGAFPNFTISAPSNTLSGDVIGTFLSNTVIALRNAPLAVIAPTIGQILAFTGAAWTPTTPPGIPLASWIKSASTVTLATNSDFVGIGASVPVAKLEITNPGNNDALRITDAGNQVAIRATNTNAATNVYAGFFDGGLVSKGKSALYNDFAFLAKDNTSTNIFSIRNNGFTTLGSNFFAAAKLNIEGSDNSTNFFGYAASPSSGITIANLDPTVNNFSSINFAQSGVESAKIVGIHTNRSAGSFRGDLVFMTRDPSNINEVMRINSFGNIGVGTTSPADKLHLFGPPASTERIRVESSGSGGSAELVLQTDNSNTSTLEFFKGGSTTGGTTAGGTIPLANLAHIFSGATGGGLLLQVVNSNPMYFATSNAERMRITPLGNVGIGATAPLTKLHVAGQITIVDGFQGDGKVLVSNNAGTATWKNTPAAAVFAGLNANYANVNTTPTQLVTGVMNFNKVYASSEIELFLNSRVLNGTFAGGASFIIYELRIDGNPAGISNQHVEFGSGATQYITLKSVFQGLAVGSHTITVYAYTDAGSSTGVLLDPGNFNGNIILKERF